MCNFIHHYGMTRRLVIEGWMTDSEMRAVRKHFCTVNKCKVKDLDCIGKSAMTNGANDLARNGSLITGHMEQP